jgi:protein-disulfide isomerase
VKGSVIVALAVGALLGFVIGRATKAGAPERTAVAAKLPSQPAAPSRPAERQQPGAEDPNALYKISVGDSPVSGSPTAKVTIVEATDFQCPFCSRANGTVKQILATYGKDVRVAIKQNPLSFHQNAHMAAEAALAAGEQGKYWEMHHKLFDNQQKLDRASLEGYAQELGLDVAKFKAALDAQKFKDRIDAEQKLVVSLGAGGTPAFFVNGRKLVGAQPFERFKQVIDEEIAKADALLAKGVKAEDLYAELTKTGATSPVMVAAPAAPEKVAVEIGNAPLKGPASAPVKIIAFSDFQCPFCSRVVPTMRQIEETYPGKVAVAFKQFPLPFHDKADLAAQAALAAHEQGKFWEMHDKLFANQGKLDRESLEGYAKELGLDVQRFNAALDSGKFKEQIAKDKEQGSKAGVSGTPSFVVNGKLVVGAQPFEEFKRAIDEALSAR